MRAASYQNRTHNRTAGGAAALGRRSNRHPPDSGIVNDSNLYATETVGDARYPLDLFRRVVTVSLGTMKLVRVLPKLDL